VRPSRTALAVSPDGRLVAFSATRGTVTQLYLRGLDRLDRAEATPVPGTDGALGPFFSPDGAWIGFWADNKLKKVPTAGGPASAIADAPPTGAPGFSGASWGEDGTIFFAAGGPISKVSSAGGTPTTVATPDVSIRERFLLPQPVPGGKALLFTATTGTPDWETANVVLQSLDTGERRVLVPGGADARYISTGHLVYMKTGTLMAVAFDPQSRQVTGAHVALIDDVMQAMNARNGVDETGAGQFAVSTSGTLLYVVGGIGPIRNGSLVWVGRTGAAQPLAAPPAGYFGAPRLSPDGQKVAVHARRGASRASDIWVYDALPGTPRRLTFDGHNTNPIWSPDGKRLVYGSSNPAIVNFYAINVDGSGKPEHLAPSDSSQGVSSWSAAANAIAFLSSGIWVLPMEGDRKPWLFLKLPPFRLRYPEISPDGHWMAYVSNESGVNEVYVQPYPGGGEKIQISTAGGEEPIWVAKGRELLYRTSSNQGGGFFSVAIRSLSPFRKETPRRLFEDKANEYVHGSPIRAWDVSADGQRFLLTRLVESTDKPVTVMHVVLNWTEELKRLVPTK
jgi:serine/threonine-protein kinase